MQRIVMKRFPDRDPGRPGVQGVYIHEAKQYGAGAFCYDVDGYGTPYLLFRYPGKADADADEEIAVGSVPLEGKGWTFDGNEDAPTISPSILYRTLYEGEWIEKFHGFIRNGYLEVL